MTQSHFYAMLSRMKYISRWGLMNNTRLENISEHSQQVAILAHCLVLIHNKRFGGSLDPERAALLAVFHDAAEIITGDLPTPIKYANREILDSYREIEDRAADRHEALRPFVKAADRFSALIKCIEEMRMGNDEFRRARETIAESIRAMQLPEAEVFEREFLPAFSLPLDELG